MDNQKVRRVECFPSVSLLSPSIPVFCPPSSTKSCATSLTRRSMTQAQNGLDVACFLPALYALWVRPKRYASRHAATLYHLTSSANRRKEKDSEMKAGDIPQMNEILRYYTFSIPNGKSCFRFSCLLVMCWHRSTNATRSERTLISRTERKPLFLVKKVIVTNTICVIRQFIVMTVVKICCNTITCQLSIKYEGWNFNSGNYLFTTHTR